ncbi:MAG: sigma-70 family RNA polymerase sigma factor [Acidobacteriaceae bacterium]|nr:sigma-70 family RNA polymerase sigma factor [Acidobacteriaceae bacterium]
MRARKAESDERLLIEAAQQDPGRFAELYESHFFRVYAFVVRRVRDRTEAEDVTSEVFHHALANIRRFEWRGVPFAAWLMRIASNIIADRWQQSAREARNAEPAEKVAPLDEIERQATLFQLVERLPEDQRRVIVMRFAEQKSIKDIAQDLGRSEGAVKQLQFRALEKLRDQLGGAKKEGADA